MTRTIPHIQEALDRAFPGVKLEWSPKGYFVLTDFVYGNDGSVASYFNYSTPRELQGLINSDRTNRVILVIFVDEDGDPIAPSRDTIINGLYGGYHGARLDSINEMLDKLEHQEEHAGDAGIKQARDAGREMARITFDRHVGKVYASASGVTSQMKIRREMAKTLAQRQLEQDNGALADEEVMQRLREGPGGISMKEARQFGSIG